VAARFPRAEFDMAKVRRFETQTPPALQAVAVVLFLLVLGATLVFLWFAHTLPFHLRAAAVAALVLVLWSIGLLLEGQQARSRSAAEARIPDGRATL
jgi:hypothetical protein